MSFEIKKNDELKEIINTFPFLEDFLMKLGINYNNIPEEISIYSYFKNVKNFSDYEIQILLKKINSDIKYYLKHGKLYETKKGIINKDISDLIEIIKEEE
jgi:hypothetical protein